METKNSKEIKRPNNWDDKMVWKDWADHLESQLAEKNKEDAEYLEKLEAHSKQSDELLIELAKEIKSLKADIEQKDVRIKNQWETLKLDSAKFKSLKAERLEMDEMLMWVGKIWVKSDGRKALRTPVRMRNKILKFLETKPPE